MKLLQMEVRQGHADAVALVIDLDGTLLRSDLLLETGLHFLRARPLKALTLFVWLLRDKAALKHSFAAATNIDVSVLPYDESVIDLIKTERSRGRRVVLATASHRILAERVAEHLQFFDEVIATDVGRNLTAEAKRDALVHAFGEQGFDYVGNSNDDLPVWRAARHAYIVNPTTAVERSVAKLGNVAGVFRSDQASVGDWVRALRLHQWLKNLLLFVPLLAAHLFTNVPLVLDALLGFLCFSLCSSSVYILNDLIDVGDDRHHLTKRLRPFASGRLSIQSGLLVSPLLLVAAFGLALWRLPLAFIGALATYYALTLVYSLSFKRHSVVDVITLATLYTLRVLAGTFAIDVPLSFWLLAFSMFIFLSLALVKRYAELYQARIQGRLDKVRGRGYYPEDLQMIAALGAAAGYMAVMVLALYINDMNTTKLYGRPEIIWLACPLLLAWISRVWILAHRGQMSEDPLIFALQDRMSQLSGAVLALILWAAT